MQIKVTCISPYATDGNIGRACNEDCSQIRNPEDWILLRDGDTMFLTPEWGALIEDTIREFGDEYKLLGARTNRVKEPLLRDDDMFDEMDLRPHLKRAVKRQNELGTLVEEVDFDIPGYFMLFQKKTWEQVGGFDEHNFVFDRIFTRKVRKIGGKVGVMQGLYVLHGYRLWSDDPFNETGHFKGV